MIAEFPDKLLRNLRFSGWFPERQVDISRFEQQVYSWLSILPTPYQKEILQSFHGLSVVQGDLDEADPDFMVFDLNDLWRSEAMLSKRCGDSISLSLYPLGATSDSLVSLDQYGRMYLNHDNLFRYGNDFESSLTNLILRDVAPEPLLI